MLLLLLLLLLGVAVQEVKGETGRERGWGIWEESQVKGAGLQLGGVMGGFRCRQLRE